MRLLPIAAALSLILSSVVANVAAQTSGAATTVASAKIPVVVAVDTSRSLNGSQLSEVVDRLRLALEDLDGATPTALLSFDDQPRWIVEPMAAPGEVQRALQELTPRGQFTLLNDALFVATRALEDGGVILLATDGRDENSATTVEDIARRCEAQGVRILSLGSGRSIEERSLRRLALLTGGEYLGPVVSTDASQIATAVQQAKVDLAQAPPSTAARSMSPTSRPQGSSAQGSSSQGSSSQSSPATEATEAGVDASSTTSGGQGAPRGAQDAGSAWYTSPLWAALAVLLLALVAYFLGRRAAKPSHGADGAADAFEVPDLIQTDEPTPARIDEAVEARLATFPVASMADAPEVTVDTAVFYGSSLEDRLEKTRVLTDRGVLISRRADDSPRLYLLSFDKAFAVGRSREINTLAIPDPALSANHFRVVPDGQDYYLLDMQSTNGSFLNGHAVRSKKLASGDVIRAGQVEFEFQSQTSALGTPEAHG